MYIYIILVTIMCFNDTSIAINEDQGLVVFSILLTNPSSADITIPIITNDVTANGEVDIAINTYIDVRRTQG